ncbi:hypothetical protein N7454_000401 [Penicillium verhagenii]|nr:hypothetical protein N7454_000401 [Penicillium verhagenii]
MADRILLPTIFDAMIDNAIKDGSHEALHSIVSIEKLGALGPVGMELMSWAWTKAKSAAAKKAYAPNHTSSFIDMMNARAGTGNTGAGGIMDNLCDGCVHCFRFLVGKGIISTAGFDQQGRGYMYLASDQENLGIVNFLTANIPLEHVFYPQHRHKIRETIFGISLKFEPSMWVLLRRLDALPMRWHPGHRLGKWIKKHSLFTWRVG